MGKSRSKGMKRSHMKRFASDNIQVKSGTRQKANLLDRQFYVNPRPFAISPNDVAYLDRVFPGVVVMTANRKAVIERRNKMINNVDPARCQFLFKGKIRTVQMYIDDDAKSVHLVEINHQIQKMRKSLTYSCRHKIKKEYMDGTINWRPYTPINSG